MASDDNGPLPSEDVSNSEDEPAFLDLFAFCVNFVHCYKESHVHRKPSNLSMESMKDLQCCLLKFVALIINTVVLEMMTQQEDSQSLPSRRLGR